MLKVFNTTGVCIPEQHYMVNITERLRKIKELIDTDCYFVINKARQYGKTTTLRALYSYLQKDYYVVLMDFQMFGNADFDTEHDFAVSFVHTFVELLEYNDIDRSEKYQETLSALLQEAEKEKFALRLLFKGLKQICATLDRPLVLMIDEVDSASDNQVFVDFLAQLRSMYLGRDLYPAFKSVILAGVYDIRNLRQKIRGEEEHKYNSPWNIAADFDVDMSFSSDEIAQMLMDYERDHETGMNIREMADLLYDYTSGYPFLVSRLCQLLDRNVREKYTDRSWKEIWNYSGFNEAVRILLNEKNMLFESLSEKLTSYPELNEMLQALLFNGKTIVYNYYEPSINIATMFGFVKNQNGILVISNRIFETWLYNLYLSTAEIQKSAIYSEAIMDKNQFLMNGRLNMRLVLEKFVTHVQDIYGDCSEKFIEEEGRKYFLLYLRSIINGTGNYYIEARTREQKRTDVIVDYKGEQFIIEMKIWRGKEYNDRGEQQLVEYLNRYHLNVGYMLSFNFNKKKKVGIQDVMVGEKRIVEAVV